MFFSECTYITVLIIWCVFIVAFPLGVWFIFFSSKVIVNSCSQEAIVLPPFVALAVRPRPGVWEYVRVNVYELSVDHLSVAEYLKFKEELVDGQ